MSRQTFPWLAHYQAGVSPRIDYPLISLSQMLEDSAEKYPTHAALVFQGAKITYASLVNMVGRLATALNGLGVKKGDRVAVMLPNCPQWVISYYAVLKLGAVLVQTNPMYVERELERQLNDSGAKLIIVLDSLYPRVKNIRANTPLEQVVCVSFSEQAEIDNTLGFETLLKSHPASPPEVKIDPREDVAVFQYTGGTTGVSKGVMLTHYNLVANAYQVRCWMPMCREGQERILTVLPLFHIYSLTACNNLSVLLGGAQYLMPRFDVNNMLQVINDFKPTIFPGAPTMYIAMINHPRIADYDVKSIRVCISGSAPLPLEVSERFYRLTGGYLVEAYGLSEASPATHLNPLGGNDRAGSIGLPAPDTEARIMDMETGKAELPAGQVGELAVRGPQVMQGYWNMPGDTAAALRDSWLYTGDLAKMDEDGYFYIVDRKKDIIIAGGFNIYPREVEEVLYEHPKVQEAVVVGAPDSYRGETVKAFLVLRPGMSASQDEITSYCREKLAAYKIPQRVEFCDSLPKTAVGKILRRALRELHQAAN